MYKPIIFPFSLLLLLSATNSFIMQTDDCQKPTIVQYLKGYVVPESGLENLVKGKNVTLASVSVNQTLGYYSLNNITCAFKYEFGSTYSSGPLERRGVESISLHLTWKANHRHQLRTDVYDVYADVVNMTFSYTKSYNKTTKRFEIEISNKFTSDMIHEGYDNKTHPKDKDVVEFKKLITDKLYPEIKAELTKIENTIKQASISQTVPIIFSQNTYTYKYGDKQIKVDTSALEISGNETVISYGYKGDVNGNPGLCPEKTPNINNNFNLYFSKEFIDNFGKSLQQFNVKIISSKNAAGFQFRLIDLEFVLGGFGQLAQYFYESISFTCKSKLLGTNFDDESIKVNANWTCLGYLSTPDTQILDVTLTTVHTLNVGVKQGNLLVQQDAVTLSSSEYRSVGSLIVQNTKLADIYAKLFISDFVKIETIGTGFKLGPSSTIAVFENKKNVGVGIWVG